MTTPATQAERIVFPAHTAPIGIFFAVVPAMVMVACAIAISFARLPVILMILLLCVMGCCVALLKTAIEEMGEVTVEWSNLGISVARVLGKESYYWSHIERVGSFDPGATFGDNGRHEESRLAIGLFIRDPQRKDRVDGDAPDVMIVSRVGSAADKIPKTIERLTAAKRYGGGKEARKLGGASPPNSRAARSFRRTATVTKA